jgi:ribosomal protein S18 acetylase RimI-like enzyme
MEIRSLGYRTDLFFPTFDGQIIDRGSYLVIRTPTNPTFFWGNFLIFAQPPRDGDFEAWRDLFTHEIGTPPGTKHQVFGWDSPEGEEGVLQPFLEYGFRLERNVVLTSHELRKDGNTFGALSVRPLQSDPEWLQAVENQVVCWTQEFGEGEYREFRGKQMERYQKMSAAGHGDWYGAFMGEKLVADLGLFHNEGVGRFQSVETHPDYRRRGIAWRLIAEAGSQAMKKYSLHTLVIVAEQDSSAARLYTSLGFEIKEQQLGLEWYPALHNTKTSEVLKTSDV